jgi:hypothetical protein
MNHKERGMWEDQMGIDTDSHHNMDKSGISMGGCQRRTFFLMLDLYEKT